MVLSCNNFYYSIGDLPVSAEVSIEVVGPSDDKVDSNSMIRQNG